MEIIPTGVAGLDEKIEKKGLYAGSCTLVSGSSGAGKTSLSASFAVEAMKKNKRCIYFAFEESIPQLKRNMLSVGFDLEKYEQSDLLKIISTRPSLFGLESHLVSIFNSIEAFQPEVVIFDPVTVLIQVGTRSEIRGMLLRIIDYLKSKVISVFLPDW